MRHLRVDFDKNDSPNFGLSQKHVQQTSDFFAYIDTDNFLILLKNKLHM